MSSLFDQVRSFRLLLVAVLLVSGVAVAADYTVYGETPGIESKYDEETEPRESVTVVSSHSFSKRKAALSAYAANGSRLYFNSSRDGYWDVDPSPEGDSTVTYVTGEYLTGAACDAANKCTRSIVARANLTTGETSVLFSMVNPGHGASEWHDVDRVGEHRLLVGDIYRNEAFVINTTTNVVEFAWKAQTAYSIHGGGKFGDDWTHLNDVELVRNDTVMISLRNQDQVVFVDMERGLQEAWTLGSDDDHSVLYEQHNPDYIPAENGGPAILVADSQNNRIVEYQRVDGQWERSWVWRDSGMHWPRDADRLPNGHTLITDTNSNRVLEVDQQGDVVWNVSVFSPYEAERLGTGDESAGGESARALGLPSRNQSSGSDSSSGSTVGGIASALVPAKVMNALIFVIPNWLDLPSFAALGVLGLAGVVWLYSEYRSGSARRLVRRL